MKEFVDKLIKRLEEETIALEDNYGDLVECIPKEIAISIVNQLAEEYKQQLPNDLMIVSSLPSLYPLQDFEEEAVHRVVGNANIPEMDVNELFEKDKQNDGWIPCSERLPEGEEYIIHSEGVEFYKHVLTTTNDMDAPICVGWYDREYENWYDLEGFVFYPIAWQPIPEPFQPKGE